MATKKLMKLQLNLTLNKLKAPMFCLHNSLKSWMESKIYNTYSTKDKL